MVAAPVKGAEPRCTVVLSVNSTKYQVKVSDSFVPVTLRSKVSVVPFVSDPRIIFTPILVTSEQPAAPHS